MLSHNKLPQQKMFLTIPLCQHTFGFFCSKILMRSAPSYAHWCHILAYTKTCCQIKTPNTLAIIHFKHFISSVWSAQHLFTAGYNITCHFSHYALKETEHSV